MNTTINKELPSSAAAMLYSAIQKSNHDIRYISGILNISVPAINNIISGKTKSVRLTTCRKIISFYCSIFYDNKLTLN